jgi:hypothetical protein
MAAKTGSIFMKPRFFGIMICSALVTAGLILPALVSADTRLGILPQPDAVHIRLSNQNPAMVQEHHQISLGKGINQVAFSWSGVRLDPDAVLLTPLSDPESVRVLSASMPPDGAGLIWQVYSSNDAVVPMILSYLPAGLDSLVTYTATVNAGETALDLDAKLILRNFSGQPYESATVRLDFDTVFSTQIQDQETRQVSFPIPQNPEMTKILQWDGQTMPHDPENQDTAAGIPFGYEITFPADAVRDTFDLRPGNVRIFLEDTQGRTLFTGEDFLPFLAKGDSFFLETGRTRDVIITKRRMKTDDIQVRRNDKGTIQVFDQIITDRFILKNTRTTPADIRLIDRITGQWEPVDMGHTYTLEDHETLRLDIHLDAEETRTFDLTYKILNIFADKFTQYNQVAYQ